jgi:phosphatidate cytidylyltransferase
MLNKGDLVLKQRIITGLILAPLVLCGVFLLEPVYFSWFFAFILAIAGWEWANLSSLTTQVMRVTYAMLVATLLFTVLPSISVSWVLTISVMWWIIATLLVMTYPASSKYWKQPWITAILGLVVLLPMWKALVFIREAQFVPIESFNPLLLILYILLLVWAADVGAYFTGKAWGKSKLAPNVSPGKSWAGAWGGVTAAIILGVIASYWMDLSLVMSIQFLVITALTAVVSIIGDLTESMFKRTRGIKDSSALLPGHGGVLDRIDSLLAAIPVFVFLLMSIGWVS